MDFAEIQTQIVTFVADHREWAAPIVFVLALLESVAFLSLLVPATAILLGIGALVGAAGIEFLPLWLAGGLGGALGYSISYWLGYWFRDHIYETRPFSRYPELVGRANAFFARFGVLSVFFGHFVGPIRAVIPVIAGTCGVRHLPFEIANFASSFIWITFVLAPGYIFTGTDVISKLIGLFR